MVILEICYEALFWLLVPLRIPLVQCSLWSHDMVRVQNPQHFLHIPMPVSRLFYNIGIPCRWEKSMSQLDLRSLDSHLTLVSPVRIRQILIPVKHRSQSHLIGCPRALVPVPVTW